MTILHDYNEVFNFICRLGDALDCTSNLLIHWIFVLFIYC